MAIGGLNQTFKRALEEVCAERNRAGLEVERLKGAWRDASANRASAERNKETAIQVVENKRGEHSRLLGHLDTLPDDEKPKKLLRMLDELAAQVLTLQGKREASERAVEICQENVERVQGELEKAEESYKRLIAEVAEMQTHIGRLRA